MTTVITKHCISQHRLKESLLIQEVFDRRGCAVFVVVTGRIGMRGADPAVIEMGKSERKQGLRFTSCSLCDWSRTMYLIVI